MVPVSVLRQEPFLHEWGASIWVKVSANNIIGQGPFSENGNGAIMLTTPEAPINLSNNPAITNANQIGLTWEENPMDGGAPVIDYTLQWDRAQNLFEVYELQITGTSYTVTGLTPSLHY